MDNQDRMLLIKAKHIVNDVILHNKPEWGQILTELQEQLMKANLCLWKAIHNTHWEDGS